MYILLNIKDSDKAAEAISLLIRNNFLSMVTGQELREVCTDCAQRRNASESPRPASPAAPPPPPPQPTPQARSVSYQTAATTSRKRKISPPEPKISVLEPQPLFEMEPLITCKDEQHDGGVNITELETSMGMSEFSEGPLTKLKRQPKKKPTEAKEGRQGLNCTVCNGFITWGGSTPMANIERHIKLHASREQFSCSLCAQQFTRRYEVRKHLEHHHPYDLECAEIIDHEQELRSEYDSLWIKCFPGVDFEEYKTRKKNYFVPPASNFHSNTLAPMP